MTVTITVCEPDVHTRRTLRALRPATHKAAGLAVPPIKKLTLGDLADALLVALGKDPVLKMFRSDPVAVAGGWLSVTEPFEVVVVDAHLITPTLQREFLTWLAGHNIDVLLVAADPDPQHPSRKIDQFVAHIAETYEATVITEADLVDRWPATEPAAASDPMPQVPLVDGFVFRTAARDLLEPDDFARVDAAFTSAVGEIRQAIRAVTDRHPTKPIAQMLRRRLDRTATTNDFLIEARAAQVGALTEGFHVRVDSLLAVAGADRLPRRGRQPPEGWWEKLDRYREPSVPAVVALYDARVGPDDIADLTIADIILGEDGTVTVGDTTLRPETARFVIAQRNYRVYSGAGDTDAFLVTHRFPRVKASYVRRTLTRAESDLGLRITMPSKNVRSVNAKEWLRFHGIEIEMLDRADGKAIPKGAL